MTQQAVPPYIQYATDGVQVSFPYPFAIGQASDLVVYHNDMITTAYTLTGIGQPTGGNLIFFAAPATGLLHIYRGTGQTQLTDYVSNDPFDAAAHEAALDKLTRLVQDYLETFSRIPQFPTSLSAVYRSMRLPLPVPLKLLGFNADGTQLSLYDPAIITVTPAALSGLTWAKTTQTIIATAGVNVLTATAQFPAGCLGLGVTLRVTTIFGTSNGLTTVSLGDAGTPDAWGTALDIRTLLVSNAGQWRRAPWFMVPTALNVLITTDNGGLFDNVGALKLTSHYLTVTPDA